MGKRLSDLEVARYRRDGFLAPVDALSAEQVTRLRDQLEQTETAQGKTLDFPERSKTHLLFEWADSIVHDSNVLDAVEDLIGPDILLYHLTIHTKEANSDAIIVWHQDDDYFRLQPAEHVTAWVALSDATEQAGCMRMIPGSHREGLLLHEERPDDNHLIRAGKGIFDRFDNDAGVPVPVAAGQMSLHHTHMVHSSGPNRSSDRRIGVGASYIPAHVAPTKTPPSSALLVRGEDKFQHFVPEFRLHDERSPDPRAAHSKAYEHYMKATFA